PGAGGPSGGPGACATAGQRQPYGEGRATTELAVHAHRPAVVRRDVLHDRKAEPGPTGVPGASPVHAIEAFEDPGLVAGRNTDPAVPHLEHGTPVLARHADLHAAARTRVLDRVLDQVAREEGEIPRRTANEDATIGVDPDREPCLFGAVFEASRLLGHEPVEPKLGSLSSFALQTRQVEEVRDDPR